MDHGCKDMPCAEPFNETPYDMPFAEAAEYTIPRMDGRVDGCAREEFNCGREEQVVRHQHVVKHQYDIINEYDVIHEHDYNYYDVVRHRNVVRHNDFTSHQPDYCNKEPHCCRPARPMRAAGSRRRLW